ncbi:uncharacterized protein A1O9_08004 [Exophiala aquamarina CBS 119918]|uniref:RTA1 domain protein n=1 Tax=Exophiala aquamarina CBS 119918 TaxID=1182545 RepID=A0A072PAX4_9EURO|nr:uncharacterized protein A1O9_08004 [Exophiala aquamarina CBS 119918]KEF56423.1 hypothetical protein A1O9_08004 [Exophiala aquamarina CBS 119918]
MADNSNVPIRPYNCAEYQECLTAWGYLDYLPNVPANAVFVAIFTIATAAQAILAWRHRTWGYSIAMLIGTILEVVGYGGRIGLHYNVFINTWFIMYLCCLTIAPALFTAAIYLSLSRILAIYGETLSFIRGRSITLTFISCDLISLVLQAVGGALASTAITIETRDIGVNIMIAGLSAQVAATTGFSLVCLHIMWNVRKHPERVNVEHEGFRRGKRFRAFIWAIVIAITTILIRCSFRVAELSEGFKGELANNEVLYMIFEAAMMSICVFVLTIAHPGLTLGAHWNRGKFHWNQKQKREVKK